MKEIKNSPYRSTWVPDYCNDLGPRIWNADTWQDGLIHNVVRITPKRRRIAIDCGANVGLTTIALAHYFEHVYAFEADPLTYECLVKNTEFLTNVTCFNAAISNSSDQSIDFIRSSKVSGHTHVLSASDDVLSSTVFSVNTTTLDSQSYPLRVDFVKMDIEGCEYDGLCGAANLLKRHRPCLLIEISKAKVLEFDAFHSLLKTYDYIFVDKIRRDFLFIPRERHNDTGHYFALQKGDRVTELVRRE